MKINIIGGGPAGMYFAILAKKINPAACIRVFERNPKGATYGFGVVLADQGLQHLKRADPESFRQIAAAMEMLGEQLITVPAGSIVIDSEAKAGSISRLRLLEILQRCCIELGVEMNFEHVVEALDDYLDADLVVGADGVNSLVRAGHEREFGTSAYMLTNRFAWYGVKRAFDRPALAFRSFRGGAFVGHYYRYQPDMSTFVAECDAATWSACGLDRMTDAERQDFVETVFAEDLGGHGLIANHSTWRRFPVVENARWTHGKIVLLGDAQRSVHFSIGSGTRLAMEDAIALRDALAAVGGDVPRMLALFEELRRPAVALLGDAAAKSFSWYEGFGEKLGLDPLAFAHDYMTRTGRMTDKRLRSRHPRFMSDYDARQHGAGAPERLNGETL